MKMKNKIISLFVKREHLILLSKMQFNDQNELILDIDQINQKIENTILKTERWPQIDLDYFQNSFVQIVNLTFTYYKMYFPVNSALQIRDHLKFTQSLKQINYGGVTLEEIFKQQRLRLVTSLSIRLSEEPLQPKIVNNKFDFNYISQLQSKYFNQRNPDYQLPYMILNIQLLELKPNIRPIREISIFSIQDVPQFQLINSYLIQPIINYDTLTSTFEYKFNKLMQRNSQIQQTIKYYYSQIKLFEDKYHENDNFKQLFTEQLRDCTLKINQIKPIKSTKRSKIKSNLSQIDIETEKNNIINSLNSNDSERNKSFQQSIKRAKKNESFCDHEIIRISDRQQKLKNRIRNLNNMIFNQVNNVQQNQIIQEQFDDSSKYNNQQIRKDQQNLKSLTQYTFEDSFKIDTNLHQSYQLQDNTIIKQQDNQFKDEEKLQQSQLIEQLSSSIEIQGQRKNYKFRRSQYAPDNRKVEDGLFNNCNNTEHIKQYKHQIKNQHNKSIERLTLKPIDYVQVCSGDQKLQQNEQYQKLKKQKRYQTQEKEELELNEILKWKKQSNQSLRNTLLLLQCGRSQQVLSSLMGSGIIKNQQYQSFLQPIKIQSKPKYMTPK